MLVRQAATSVAVQSSGGRDRIGVITRNSREFCTVDGSHGHGPDRIDTDQTDRPQPRSEPSAGSHSSPHLHPVAPLHNDLDHKLVSKAESKVHPKNCASHGVPLKLPSMNPSLDDRQHRPVRQDWVTVPIRPDRLPAHAEQPDRSRHQQLSPSARPLRGDPSADIDGGPDGDGDGSGSGRGIPGNVTGVCLPSPPSGRNIGSSSPIDRSSQGNTHSLQLILESDPNHRHYSAVGPRRASITDPFLHAHSANRAHPALPPIHFKNGRYPHHSDPPSPDCLPLDEKKNRRSSAADLSHILSSEQSDLRLQPPVDPSAGNHHLPAILHPDQPRWDRHRPLETPQQHPSHSSNLKRKGSPESSDSYPNPHTQDDWSHSVPHPSNRSSHSPSDHGPIKRRNSSHTIISDAKNHYFSNCTRFSSFSHPPSNLNSLRPNLNLNSASNPSSAFSTHHSGLSSSLKNTFNPLPPPSSDHTPVQTHPGSHHRPVLQQDHNPPQSHHQLSPHQIPHRYSSGSSQNGLQSRRESAASSCTSSSGMMGGPNSSGCASSSSSSLQTLPNSCLSPIPISMRNYAFPPSGTFLSSRDHPAKIHHPAHVFDSAGLSPLTLKRTSIDEVQDRLNFTQLIDHPLSLAHQPGPSPTPPPLPPSHNAYSRAPELKVSHKLAERKRRKEMRELFDELRSVLPKPAAHSTAAGGGHSIGSKWETLFRAVEFMNQLKQENSRLHEENQHLKIELQNHYCQ